MIRTNDCLPKHLDLKGKLLGELSMGSFSIGDRFYAESFVSRKYDVALLTVRRAYASLANEGFIQKKHGSGTYIRCLPESIISQKIVQSCMVGLYLESLSPEKNFGRGMFIDALAHYLNLRGMSATLIFDNFGAVHANSLDGLIFFGAPVSKEMDKIRSLGLPTVSMGAARVKSFPGVCQAKGFMRGVFGRFLGKGRRRIALLNFDSPPNLNDVVRTHLEEAISDYGAGEYIELTGERENFESVLAESLKGNRPPDAFILPKWTYVPGFMLTLTRLKLKIGADVGAFVGVCPDFLAEDLPAYARDPVDSQARLAVGMLEKMLKDRNYKGEVIEHEPQIANQESF